MDPTRKAIRSLLQEAQQPDWDGLVEAVESGGEFDQTSLVEGPLELIHFVPRELGETGQWIVDEIIEQGFRGTTDATKLAFTTMTPERVDEGWNFGVDPDDAVRHLEHFQTYYGDDALRFQVPRALFAYHLADKEYVAIFWGPQAYDRKRVTMRNDGRPRTPASHKYHNSRA